MVTEKKNMDKLHLMKKIRDVYERGGNIIEYLNTIEGEKKANSLEIGRAHV